MALAQLPSSDRDVIRQGMTAIFTGSFIEDFEFRTRMGIDRATLGAILQRWPEVDDSHDDSDVTLAINNALNEVCHGVEIADSEWARWFKVSRQEVERIYEAWARSRGWQRSGIK
jgi:hypothetical protein